MLSNFSNVWKALLYYVICITLSLLLCVWLASPIVVKLNEANVIKDFLSVVSGIFSNSASSTAITLTDVWQTFLNVLATNMQFRLNYILLVVIAVFVFPFLLDMAQLALGEVLYGFMTSQVRYGFTGRYIKNIGKSATYSLAKYVIMLPLNLITFGVFALSIRLAVLGTIYVPLSILCFGAYLALVALKFTLFSCWMPSIAVLNLPVFKALSQNFRTVFRKFFSIFSNSLFFVLFAVAVNIFSCVFTVSVGLVITMPLTAFVFVIFQMTSFFVSQGMRFYVYPDMIISPKRFEEQDNIKKLKYLL